MHAYFGLPGVMNSLGWSQSPNTYLNTNNSNSPSLFQQTTAPTLVPSQHQNAQHVFQGAPVHSVPVPDLNVLKSFPPPPVFNSNRVPEISHPPPPNQGSINHFSTPCAPQVPPLAFFHPALPAFHSNNGTYGNSIAFNGQQNAGQDSASHMPVNPFARNPVASPINASPVSSVQPTRNQSYRNSGFSNDRYSPNSNLSYESHGSSFSSDNRYSPNSNLSHESHGSSFSSDNRYSPNSNLSYESHGSRFSNDGYSPNSNLGYRSHGFRGTGRIKNGQSWQKSRFMMDSSNRTPLNSEKFRCYNRGGKKNFNGSYLNRSNVFSTDQANSQINVQGNNKFAEVGIKTERNSPVSRSHYCDTCDRAFASEGELADHVSGHVKCGFENCQFEAHYKIVASHKKMQHDTGYADTISKLKNAEDIQKWREERRRRFPTRENIAKREAERAEKEARGEVIEDKDFGKFGKVDNDNSKSKKRRRGANRTKNVNHPHCATQCTVDISDSESDSDDSHIKLPKFLGMNHVHDAENLPESENSKEVKLNGNSSESVSHEIKEGSCNSEENENTEPLNPESLITEPLNEEALDTQNDNAEALDTQNDNAEALNAENKETKALNAANEDAKPLNERNRMARNRNANGHQDHGSREYPPQRRTALLERLLDSQIRQERNFISQFIRHAVKNDFYDTVHN